MGDIKISDIKKDFRTIAENADKVENGGNGNKYLDGDEVSVFKKYASFAGATEKDFEKMGLTVEKVGTSVVTTTPQPTTGSRTLSESEQKNVNKRMKKAIKELVKHGTSKDAFVSELTMKFRQVDDGKPVIDEKTGQPVIQEAFVQAINEVKQIADAIDIDKVTTKKDVKSIKKEAKKAFPNPTEVQKEFIDNLEDWAEAAAISKRLKTLRNMYNQKLNGGHNFQIALDALKKDLKTKQNGTKEWKVDYTSEAFDLLEKDAKQLAVAYTRATLNTKVEDVDAEIERINQDLKDGKINESDAQKALAQLNNDRKIAENIAAAESKSGVRKALAAANTEGDDFLEDAYERRLAGNRSKTVKHDMEEVARENRSDHKVEATMVEVTDPVTGEKKMVSQMSEEALKHDIKTRVNGNTFWHGVGQYTLLSSLTKISSENAEKLVSKLKGNSNYYDSATNTFNLEAIRADVIEDIGDFVMNLEDDTNSSEIENLKAHMNARMGLTGSDKLNTSEARALVKLVEADVEHTDLRKAGLVGAISGVGAALAGLVGGLVAFHNRLEVTQMVQLKLDNQQVFSDITQQLDALGIEYTSTELSAGKKGITILQQVVKPDHQALNAFFGLINGLAIGAATGILTALIVGEQNAEHTCMPVGDYNIKNTRYTDPEQYKEYIGNRYSHNPIKAGAIKAMVDKYVEFYGKDNWHVEFQNDIRIAAGVGSTMNPNECMKFFSEKKYDKGIVTNNNNNDNNDNTENPVDNTGKEKITKCKTTVYDNKNVAFVANAARYGWAQVNKMYSCFDGMPDALATRMMKVIQAIDPEKVNGIYEIERIQEIARKTMTTKFGSLPDSKIREALKEYPEVDADTFIAVVHASYVGNSKAIDKENKLTTPLRLYERDANGELKVACERDLSKLVRPKTYGSGPAHNNVNAKIGYQSREDKYKVNGKPVDKTTYDRTVSTDKVEVQEVEWTD